jgi:hypothetical protein
MLLEQIQVVEEEVLYGPGGSGGSGNAGSGIAIVKEKTVTLAPGVWSLQCQYNFKKNNKWTS